MRIRILDRYIGGQVLGTTLFGVFVLCLVLVLGNIFKEVLPRLVDKTVTFDYFLKFILYVMPFSLVFTIPWGFLTAVLLVYGRLSADSELVSLRMAGISMFRLSVPVILISAVFSLFCLWINVAIAPRAKTAIESMVFDMAARNPEAILVPDQVISSFPGNIIYFREKEGERMKDVTVFETEGDHTATKFVHAKEAVMKADLDKLQMNFAMKDLYLAATEGDRYTGKMNRIQAGSSELPPYDLSKLHNRRLKAAALTNDEILAYLEGRDGRELEKKQVNPFRVELSKRYSFSLACVTFCLVGIPLGVTAQRRETAAGFAISLALASAYFIFIIVGDTFNTQRVLPHILIWLPNLLFLSLGVILFRRLNRR